MVVKVELAGDPMTFLLGSREASVDDDLEVYSATSPLGAAIIGKKAGDTTSYTSPNGKSFDGQGDLRQAVRRVSSPRRCARAGRHVPRRGWGWPTPPGSGWTGPST